MAHVLVLDGKLRVGPHDALLELGPGDYATFSADLPHSYEALGKGARALVMMSMPRHPSSGLDGYVDGSLLLGSSAAAR